MGGQPFRPTRRWNQRGPRLPHRGLGAPCLSHRSDGRRGPQLRPPLRSDGLLLGPEPPRTTRRRYYREPLYPGGRGRWPGVCISTRRRGRHVRLHTHRGRVLLGPEPERSTRRWKPNQPIKSNPCWGKPTLGVPLRIQETDQATPLLIQCEPVRLQERPGDEVCVDRFHSQRLHPKAEVLQ